MAQRRQPPPGEWPPDGLERVADCPVCGAGEREVLHRRLRDRVFFCAPGEWTLLRCRSCGCAYLDPRPTQETIGAAYARYYTHAPRRRRALAQAREALRNGYLNGRYGYRLRPALGLGRAVVGRDPWTRSTASRIVRHLPAPRVGGRLLDVGCGDGRFVELMARAGWGAEGVDPDAAAIEAGRARGAPVRRGDLGDLGRLGGGYHAITLNHVLEHVPDPVALLGACRRLLAPGGRVWIATPNLGSRGHRAFGRDWVHLDPPRHLVLHTGASLRLCLERAGLRPAEEPPARLDARPTFRASAAISAGRDPFGPGTGDGVAGRLRAALADLRAARDPGCSEEAAILAAPG